MILAHCPIAGDDVIVFIDLEGNLKDVRQNGPNSARCPEFDSETCTCAKKIRLLNNLVGVDGRAIDLQSDFRGSDCEFFDPKTMWL